VGDYSVDVVLNKVLDIVKTVMGKCRGTTEASIVLSQVQEVDRWAIAAVSSLHDDLVRTRLLPGGRLLATYTMAEMGELAYDSEVMYPAMGSSNETEELDTKVFEHLKESARSEMDCQVCYDVFLDPLTTNCGHTLCRQCLHRVLDHSNLCPLCRRRMEIPPGVSAQQASSNALLTKFISSLCHEALDLRLEAMRLSDMHDVTELDTPLFICTLSFPCTPTFLHVFEPRYRLMIRRAIESGDRKFGMLLYNPSREPQGELGRVPFYELGTLLHIVNMQLMPDGRSLLETVGVSRFRVVRHGVLDGYTVGKIERIDDVSVTEEEALEAAETSSIAGNFSAEGYDTPPRQSPLREPGDLPSLQELNSISTKELMDIGVRFVQRMQDNSASWLQRNVVHAYGECPDDPALFPWWFASVIPTSDAEKYKMLSTSSVRERLKMCVVWAAELEAQRWYASPSPPLSP
jgi:Lon protease-like protein